MTNKKAALVGSVVGLDQAAFRKTVRMNHIDRVPWMEATLARMRAREALSDSELIQAWQSSRAADWGPEAPSGQPEGSGREMEAFQGESAGGSPPKRRGVTADPLKPLPLSIHDDKLRAPCEIRGYSDRFCRRVDRYAKAVGLAEPLVSYLREGGRLQVGSVPTELRADRLAKCARYLEFRKFYTLPDEPVKLSRVFRCSQPHLCGFCAIQRSVRLLKFYHPRIMTKLGGGVRAYLGTFTATSGPDLAERFRSMSGWLSRLWRRGKWAKRGGRNSAVSLINGAVFSFEVKRGEGTRGGGWHVHLHACLLSSSDLEAAGIAAEWCEVTGQSDPKGQDVRLLESFAKFDAEDLAEAQVSESVGHDLCEVFKYPMKFGDLAVADRWEAFSRLNGRRLLRGMGELYGAEPDPAYLEEPLQLDDLPYLRMVLRYSGGRYALERSEFC